MRDLFEEMLKPGDRRTMITRVLLALWLGIVLVEFGIWLVICLVAGELESPWWLWGVLVGGVVVGGWHLATRKR
jgi:amino acid transporter